LKLLRVGTCGKTSFVPIVHKKSRILIKNDNIYMASEKMKVYFIDFFFSIQNYLSFVISVTCDLSNMALKILVANVTYNLKFVAVAKLPFSTSACL
jgi:hypothetical protein